MAACVYAMAAQAKANTLTHPSPSTGGHPHTPRSWVGVEVRYGVPMIVATSLIGHRVHTRCQDGVRGEGVPVIFHKRGRAAAAARGAAGR
eukprot:1159177-Pelagomonas_calceolata.AAC.19